LKCNSLKAVLSHRQTKFLQEMGGGDVLANFNIVIVDWLEKLLAK